MSLVMTLIQPKLIDAELGTDRTETHPAFQELTLCPGGPAD